MNTKVKLGSNFDINNFSIHITAYLNGSHIEYNSIFTDSSDDFERKLDNVLNKEAFVVLNITKILTTGAATAGKTCTKHYIFGIPPPRQYTSTDVCDPMERHYAYSSAVVDHRDPCEWKEATLDSTLAMIKNTIIIGKEKKILEFPKELDVLPPAASTTDTQVSTEDPGDVSATPVQPKDETIYSETQKRSDTIKKLLDQKISGEVLNVHWIHFVDGGGQSEFLELLPALVSNVTVTIYVINLSTKPDDHCNDFFTINGQQGTPRETSLTGKELLERFLKTVCSQKDDIKCKVMFIGTHTSSPETKGNCEAWNKLILSLWKEYKADKVEIIKVTPSLVHAIDANSRGDDEQETAKKMRKELTKCYIKKEVAIAEFLIEEDLKSSSRAQKNNGILTFSECQEITKQYATEETLKKALKYFHELNEYFYFPDEDLKLVFTKPHVLIRIISKLIKVANHCRSTPGSGIAEEFWKAGLISDKDLNVILNKDLPGEEKTEGNATDKCYRSKVFEGKQLWMVLRSLSIAAYCENRSAYLVPCVLPPYTKDDDINKIIRDFMRKNLPLLLTFKKDKEGKRGSIPRGLFCGLVTHLIDNCEWKIHSENKQNYQTLIVFEIKEYNIVLVEDFKLSCIRVHAHQRTDQEERWEIRKNIADGVKIVSKKFYRTENDSTMCPNASFICSCSYSKENKLPHIANVVDETDAKKRWLKCELGSADVPEFTKDQCDWLGKSDDLRSSGICLSIPNNV